MDNNNNNNNNNNNSNKIKSKTKRETKNKNYLEKFGPNQSDHSNLFVCHNNLCGSSHQETYDLPHPVTTCNVRTGE